MGTKWARVLVVAVLAPTVGWTKEELPRVSQPAKLQQIKTQMEQHVKAHQCAGTVTLVGLGGKVIHHEAVGQRDIDRQLPMEKDSIFAIASMTKPIAATAFMLLVADGKASPNDPVAKYIPEFASVKVKGQEQAPRPITIKDCMTHTAGLAGPHTTDDSIEATVARLAKQPLAFPPGDQWQYSPGLTVVGRVVEIVSGKPFDQFLKERIFEPLQMKDTCFRPSDEQIHRIARIYKPNLMKNGLEASANAYSPYDKPVGPSPSAGLYSTAADLFRFYSMILNEGELEGRRLLPAGIVREMTTVQTNIDVKGFTPGTGWGYGWCVVREPAGVTSMLLPGTFGHGGAFGTQGWIDPTKRMVFILLVQRSGFPGGDASDLRQSLQQLAVDAVEPALPVGK